MNEEQERPFWLVWNPQTAGCRHKHYREADAELEARRMALAHPGQRFIVMASVSVSVANAVRTVGIVAAPPVFVEDRNEPI